MEVKTQPLSWVIYFLGLMQFCLLSTTSANATEQVATQLQHMKERAQALTQVESQVFHQLLEVEKQIKALELNHGNEEKIASLQKSMHELLDKSIRKINEL